MEYLSTSAEHMNSHAMHFPCLKGSNDQSRVLACKNCVEKLTVQWETMDAQRVPLEHRKYIIPSPTPNSASISPGGGSLVRPQSSVGGTPPSTPASTVPSTSVYCFICGLHSELSFARLLYANKEVMIRVEIYAEIIVTFFVFFALHFALFIGISALLPVPVEAQIATECGAIAW